MTARPRSRPPRAWLAAVGVLMVLTIAAVLVLPRVAGADRRDEAAATTPRTTPSASTSTSPSGSPSPSVSPSSSPSAAAGALHLVGFGDSVMAGAGCDCDDFLTRVGAGLQSATGRKVVTDNNGANGETAAGLLRDLKTDDALQTEISQADVIVLTIGANDLTPALNSWDDDGCEKGCYQPEVDDMATSLTSILALVNEHKKPAAKVLVTNYWNVFEDGDVGASDYGKGYLAWSDTVTRAANDAICQVAEQGQATCVDTYAPFKADGTKDPTRLLAEDGDHPNAAGTKVIADTVTDSIIRLLPS